MSYYLVCIIHLNVYTNSKVVLEIDLYVNQDNLIDMLLPGLSSRQIGSIRSIRKGSYGEFTIQN